MENKKNNRGLSLSLSNLPATGLIACVIAFVVGYFYMDKDVGYLMNFVAIIYVPYIVVWAIYKVIYSIKNK